MRQDTRHERRGLDMNKERGLLDFWRRLKFMLAAVRTRTGGARSK